MQPQFGQEILQLHYMDTGSFVLSKKMILLKTYIKRMICFIFLNKEYELFSNENKKVASKFRIKNPKIIWIQQFICL